jgi:hypothetical protein
VGGLVGNLPDAAKIMHLKGFTCGRKDVGVEDEIKAPKVFQDTPKVEFFEPSRFGKLIVSRHVQIKYRNLRLQSIRHRLHWTLTDELTWPKKGVLFKEQTEGS